MTLEDAIDQVAREGRLHFTVFAVSAGYQANLSVDGQSWRVEMAPDPLTAARKAFGVIPGATGQLRQPQSTGSVFE